MLEEHGTKIMNAISRNHAAANEIFLNKLGNRIDYIIKYGSFVAAWRF